MSSIRVLGRTEYQAIPGRGKDWERGKGWSSTRSWRGPRSGLDAWLKQALLGELQTAERISVQEQGGSAEVTAYFPHGYSGSGTPGGEDDSLNVVWECLPEEVDKDIRSIEPFCNPAEMEQIEKYIQEGTAYSHLGDYSDEIQAYINLRLIGVQSKRTWVYTVVKTTQCGTKSDVKASKERVEEVWKKSELKIPNDAKVVVPDDYEFLKAKPSVISVPDGWRIVETWLGAEKWSAALYPGGTGTP